MILETQGEYLETAKGEFKDQNGQVINYFQMSILQGSEIIKFSISDSDFGLVSMIPRMTQIKVTADQSIRNYSGKTSVKTRYISHVELSKKETKSA